MYFIINRLLSRDTTYGKTGWKDYLLDARLKEETTGLSSATVSTGWKGGSPRPFSSVEVKLSFSGF
jgi:hypothetical protein